MTTRGRILGGSIVGAVALGVMACSEASRLNLRCYGGGVEQCRQLGEMYASGKGVRIDLGRAVTLYTKACDGGLVAVCNTLGEIYEELPEFRATPAKIQGLYERACRGEVIAGCLNLGLALSSAGDHARAVSLFERACTGGLARGCFHLAEAHARGEGVPVNLPRAGELYDQACRAEFVDGCLSAAALHAEGGGLFQDPAIVARYYTQALQIYERGCEAGNEQDCTGRDRARTRLALIAAAGR